jgi:hypothetical protein
MMEHHKPDRRPMPVDLPAQEKRMAARSLKTPSSTLIALSFDEDNVIRSTALQNPNMSKTIFDYYISKPDVHEDVLRSIGCNICAPAETLRDIHRINRSRGWDADRNQLPLSIRVDGNPSSDRRKIDRIKLATVLALNKNTPAEILEELVKSGDLYVMAAVAMNSTTPQRLIDQMRKNNGVIMVLKAIESRTSQAIHSHAAANIVQFYGEGTGIEKLINTNAKSGLSRLEVPLRID